MKRWEEPGTISQESARSITQDRGRFVCAKGDGRLRVELVLWIDVLYSRARRRVFLDVISV
jgi:hypothetical protein